MTRKIYADDYAAWITPGSPYRPSNESEGDFFEHVWCNNCAHYLWQPVVNFYECTDSIMTLSFLEDDKYSSDYPKELIHGPDGQPMCTAFKERGKREKPNSEP